MKIRITLKDPDGVYESVKSATNTVNDIVGLYEEEKEDLIETRREKIFESIQKWVEFDEYVTIEIDTDKNTAIVIPVR